MELTEEQRKIFESVDVKFLDDNVSKRYGEACFTAGLAEGSREPMEVLRELVAAHEAEATTTLTLQNAKDNFSDSKPEILAYERAMIRSNKAERAARELCARYPK